MRRPGDNVHRGRVVRELGDATPATGTGLVSPDEDMGVVGGRCENGSVFRMRLPLQSEENVSFDPIIERERYAVRGRRGSRTHETHQTAPSCLENEKWSKWTLFLGLAIDEMSALTLLTYQSTYATPLQPRRS